MPEVRAIPAHLSLEVAEVVKLGDVCEELVPQGALLSTHKESLFTRAESKEDVQGLKAPSKIAHICVL